MTLSEQSLARGIMDIDAVPIWKNEFNLTQCIGAGRLLAQTQVEIFLGVTVPVNGQWIQFPGVDVPAFKNLDPLSNQKLRIFLNPW